MDNNIGSNEMSDKPTNEEILEGVKKQSKGSDEYETKALMFARSIGFGAALILASIITLVCVILDMDEITYVMWFVIFGSQSIANIYYAVKVERKRRLFLAVGIMQAVVTPVMLAAWILTLCGIL